ncbi:WbqC family protein [Patescibacteria group bacterium]|nr:WbqC family protein [Patescibacteria group bacterium]
MRLFVMQPTYLPWIGIFKAIDYCDSFIFYDDVQFEKQSWQQRNKILNRNQSGKSFIYLRVPVERHSLQTSLGEIKIRDVDFYEEHLAQIRSMYRKARYAQEVIDVLEDVYRSNFGQLVELNIALIKKLSAYIGLETEFYQSGKLPISGEKRERLVNFCKYFQAHTYFSAPGAKDYLDSTLFEENGIAVEFLDFEHPIYPQVKDGFVSHLSTVDILVHLGPERTKEVIQGIQLKPSESRDL